MIVFKAPENSGPTKNASSDIKHGLAYIHSGDPSHIRGRINRNVPFPRENAVLDGEAEEAKSGVRLTTSDNKMIYLPKKP